VGKAIKLESLNLGIFYLGSPHLSLASCHSAFFQFFKNFLDISTIIFKLKIVGFHFRLFHREFFFNGKR